MASVSSVTTTPRGALDTALDMLFSLGHGSQIDHVLGRAREELEYLRSVAPSRGTGQARVSKQVVARALDSIGEIVEALECVCPDANIESACFVPYCPQHAIGPRIAEAVEAALREPSGDTVRGDCLDFDETAALIHSTIEKVGGHCIDGEGYQLCRHLARKIRSALAGPSRATGEAPAMYRPCPCSHQPNRAACVASGCTCHNATRQEGP